MYDDNWFTYPSEDLDWDFDSDFYDDFPDFYDECDVQEVDLGITDDNWLFGTLEVDQISHK